MSPALSPLPLRSPEKAGRTSPPGQSRVSLSGMRFPVQSRPGFGAGTVIRKGGLNPIPERNSEASEGTSIAAPHSSLSTIPAPALLSRTEDGPSIPPDEFAEKVLRVELWGKQLEVLRALPQHRRVAVKAGNGLGKGFSAAVAVLWYLHTHNPAIVLSTAPTFRQVRFVLWRQIHSLYRRAPDALQGKLLDTRWDLGDDRYAMGISADSADQFQGFHCRNMLIVVDEAEGVSDSIYEAIEAVMTSEGSRLLLIGNPTTLTGAFRRAFHEERSLYHCITISALDSPNVVEGRVVFPGLTTAQWVAERKKIWGEDNSLYRARVLGEFPEQSDNTLIRLSDVEAAANRWQALPPPDMKTPAALPASVLAEEGVLRQAQDERVLGQAQDERSLAQVQDELEVETGRELVLAGRPSSLLAQPEAATAPPGDVVLAVDVARYGSDHSVILRRRGLHVEEIRTFNGMDTMELAGWVAAAIREFQPLQTCIDEIGVGAGVVDRLREQGYGVRGVNVAHAARQKDIFANLRAEGYWRLRELFAAGELTIPSDQQLIGELAAIQYKYDSQGRILMEPKEESKKRGLPSPDRADALMLSFAIPISRPRIWT